MSKKVPALVLVALLLILSSIACKYITITSHDDVITMPSDNRSESGGNDDVTPQGTYSGLSLIADHVYGTSAAIHYIGLLKNDTSNALGQIQIELELIDADGNTVTKRTIYPFLSVVQSGDIVPFQTVFLQDEIASDNGPFGVRGHVVDANAASAASYYHEFSAIDVNSQPSTSNDLMTLAVSASLNNTGSRSTSNVKAAIVLLDSEQRPLRMAVIYVPGVLAPGDASEIAFIFQEYSPFDDLPLAETIIVFAEGR